MIKPAALILAVAMGAVSAGTYFGLDLLPPGAIPEPFGRAHKPEPPKPGTHALAAAPATQSAAAAPVQPAPAPAEQPVTEQDLAEEPPPPEPAVQAQAEPAAEPAPAPEPARPAPKPKQHAPVTVVREEEPAAPKTEVASAAPAPTRPKPADADVIKPWWPDSSQLPPNQLKLQYAGQVQGEQAIALLFSAPLNLDSLRQHAQVRTESGQAVGGSWELGKNTRLAVFRGVDSGRYTVILAPQVADTKGFMLGQTLKGPVYIQAPQ